MLRTVDEALQALSRLTNYERTRADGPRDFNLDRPRRLLAALGGPDRSMGAPVIQVAGTKGKGSTARFLSSILRAAGRRTGLFTSPHLESVRERIAVDGAPIAEADFARCVGEALAAVDTETTFFEAMLAAACVHFARSGTDAVVLEVGLGGRLDATTVVPVTHNVITEISFDHTEILGHRIEEIAAEKASTIRPGVPVFSGVDPAGGAGGVIARFAAERGAPLTYVPPPDDLRADAAGLLWNGVQLRTLGRHQAHNAALAAACLADASHDPALGLAADEVARALARADQPGCCERRGNVLLDGAHTVSSIVATLRALDDHFPGVRPHLVLALAQDKDLDGIASALADRVDRIWCTRADERRGMDVARMAGHAAWEGRAVVEPRPALALQAAQADAGPGGLVLVTGSLYLAGALRQKTRTR